MDKYLEIHKLPKPTQKKKENLIKLRASRETESVIKNLPTKKSPQPDVFTSEFYQTLKKGLTPVLLILFQKIEENTF